MPIFSLVIVFAASKYSRLFNLVLTKNVFLIGNYKNNTGLHVILCVNVYSGHVLFSNFELSNKKNAINSTIKMLICVYKYIINEYIYKPK